MRIRFLHRVAAALACAGTALPQLATATQPGVPAPYSSPAGQNYRQQAQSQQAFIDVALGQGGLFAGQVVNAQGVAAKGAEVVLKYQGTDVVRTVTDENGSFAARGLRGGQYELHVSEGVVHCRLWNAQAAPPAARPNALIVADSDVMNGQLAGGGLFSKPVVIAGVVGGVVAASVAIHQNNEKDKPSS